MNKLKNIIVLKGMSSNVVEEAIVILKPNVKLRQNEYMTYEKHNESVMPNKKVIQKEAENVIKLYIEKINENIDKNKNEILVKKYERMKIYTSILIIINILLIINIF